MGASFITVDLVLKARFDLRPLARVLEERGLFVYGGPVSSGGVSRVRFGSNLCRPTKPQIALEYMLREVEGLQGEHRAAWDRCIDRQFDFGYECCDDTFESMSTLDHRAVSRISQVGGSVAVTIYRPASP